MTYIRVEHGGVVKELVSFLRHGITTVVDALLELH